MDKNKAKPNEITKADEDFLRAVLAAVHTAVTERGANGAFGELTLKILQEGGRIKTAKILEEALLRPGDSGKTG